MVHRVVESHEVQKEQLMSEKEQLMSDNEQLLSQLRQLQRTAALRSRPRGGKAATTAELKTRQAASAKALERLKGAGGVKVVFKNTLRSTVEMFWMKDEETLLPQGEIAGGQSMEVGSHGGHTFVMKARGEGEGRREWRFAIDGALGAKQTLSNSEKTAKQSLSNSASGRKEL